MANVIEPVINSRMSLVLLVVTFGLIQENFSVLVSGHMGGYNKIGNRKHICVLR